jgi:hypothetical protein
MALLRQQALFRTAHLMLRTSAVASFPIEVTVAAHH